MQSQELGDYIGVESCVDLKPDVTESNSSAVSRDGRRWRRGAPAEKVYPPQIYSLARTENLPSHIPWVMKKYYTGDGRLVIKEEKAKRREYFQAQRSNGRLVMTLVPLDDAVDKSCEGHRAGGEDELDCVENAEGINGGEEGITDRKAEDAVSERCKCSRMQVNPCGGGFGVATGVTVAGV